MILVKVEKWKKWPSYHNSRCL